MFNQVQDYHLLHIADFMGERSYLLNGLTYSLGRDSNNSIVINDPAVSRHHALLICIPISDHRYVYRIIDGDGSGQPSRNGLLINEYGSRGKTLETGDNIKLGRRTLLSYLMAQVTHEDYLRYLVAQTPGLYCIKPELLDPTGTLDTSLSA